MSIEALTEILRRAEHAVFLGGAGVSTESGIPDFRGNGGLYQKERSNGEVAPEQVLTHTYLLRHPESFYRYYRGNMLYPQAVPNAAHLALAKLEQMGKLSAVITQNIDGLHQRAGSENVLELHGSTLRNRCMQCGTHYGLDAILSEDEVPVCPDCGGLIRPDVVLYGEPLDSKTFYAAQEAIDSADVLIVGGTSLTVQPAASLVTYFRGDRFVIINRSPTPYDGLADLLIDAPIGEVLGAAVDAL